MNDIIAKATFDCIDRKGSAFVTTVSVYREKGACGTDSLMALSFAIENTRQILRAFVNLGGQVYATGTKIPIDVDSPTFQTHPEHLLNPEFRNQ